MKKPAASAAGKPPAAHKAKQGGRGSAAPGKSKSTLPAHHLPTPSLSDTAAVGTNINGAVHVSSQRLLSLLVPTIPLASGTTLASHRDDRPAAAAADGPAAVLSSPTAVQTNRRRQMMSSVFGGDSADVSSAASFSHYQQRIPTPQRPPPLPPAQAAMQPQPSYPSSVQAAAPPPTFLPLAHTQYVNSGSSAPHAAARPSPRPVDFSPLQQPAPPSPIAAENVRAAYWTNGADAKDAWGRPMQHRGDLEQQLRDSQSLRPAQPSPSSSPPATSRAPSQFASIRSHNQASSVFGEGRAEGEEARRQRVREETQQALLQQIAEKKQREEERKRREDEEERKFEERIERERREIGRKLDPAAAAPEARQEQQAPQRVETAVRARGEEEEKQQLTVVKAERRKEREERRRTTESEQEEEDEEADRRRRRRDRHRRRRHRHRDSDSDDSSCSSRSDDSRRHRRRDDSRSRQRHQQPDSDNEQQQPQPQLKHSQHADRLKQQHQQPPPPAAPVPRPPFGVRSMNTKSTTKPPPPPAARRSAPPPPVNSAVLRQLARANNLARGKTSGGGDKFIDRKWKGKDALSRDETDAAIRTVGEELSEQTAPFAAARAAEAADELALQFDRLESTSEWLLPQSLGLPSYRA